MEKNTNRNPEEVFGVKVRAGKRRTYFFDVKPTKQGDYYICITESKRKFDGDGYERHKVYVYKEDFNKFMSGMEEAVNHVKTVLLPDFDFDSFNNTFENETEGSESPNTESQVTPSNIYDAQPSTSTETEDSENRNDGDASSDSGMDLDTAEEW